MPRLRKYDGALYRRKDTPFWWIRYRDRSGVRRAESSFTKDWQEAQTILRERLQARDNNVLDVIRKGKN
jgi:transposase-like protein